MLQHLLLAINAHIELTSYGRVVKLDGTASVAGDVVVTGELTADIRPNPAQAARFS